MRDDASLPSLRRNPGMDALRTLAILGMMAAHTSRLIVFESREAWSYWILLLEPLIPSLFLFLVGISLTYSIAKSENSRKWYARQARRALILWLIAALFSGLEYGIRLPDVLFASGISLHDCLLHSRHRRRFAFAARIVDLGACFGPGNMVFHPS